METDVYFSAAILGAILALIFILGWRRIVPVLVVGYIVGTTSSFAQGYDQDNDVPTLTQIRDQIIAQQTMLDNYFSGYTAPNKLNDISNYLQAIEADTDNLRNDKLYHIKENTADISNNLEHNGVSAAQNLSNISYYTQKLKEAIYQSNGASSIKENTNNTAEIADSLNYGTYSLADLSKYINDNVTDINNYSEDSLTELQSASNSLDAIDYKTTAMRNHLTNISGNTLYNTRLLDGTLPTALDTDNDVPKLTEIATSTENGYLQMKAVREKMDAVYGDPVANDFQGIVTQQPAYVAPTLETFDEQVASKPSPTIGYDLQNNDTGFEAIPESFDISGFQNTSIHLIGTISTPSIGGDLIGTINYKMGEHASFLSGIIKPILTAWVCYLILSFTTRKTVDLIAA